MKVHLSHFWIAVMVLGAWPACQVGLGGEEGKTQTQISRAESQAQLRETQALRMLPDSKATTALLDRANSPHPRVRMLAVVLLGTRSDPRGLKSIQQALSDVDPRVRAAAVAAVVNRRSRGQYRQILDLANDSDELVRGAVCRAAGRLGWTHALPVLRELLQKDPAVFVRGQAMWALARTQKTRSTPLLIDAIMTDQSPAVRFQAAVLLREFSPRRTGAELRTVALNDRDGDVRRAAIRALTPTLSSRDISNIVLAVLRRTSDEPDSADDDPADGPRTAKSFSAVQAGELLGALGKLGVPALARELRSSNPLHRRVSLLALQEIGDPRIMPLVQKLAKDDPVPAVRQQARKILVRRKPAKR